MHYIVSSFKIQKNVILVQLVFGRIFLVSKIQIGGDLENIQIILAKKFSNILVLLVVRTVQMPDAL